ncbi:hypothetical protein Ddye_018454 [Dipteronia dyeriana]|uniref:Uncharacterized protein n=1 Tax=Dipteronia dyeriana TaxID=168575 RepID=A0AAD9UBG6_9ROSI|nr:hypothetical protein Ddye_018454 [Dipteronia dyeriana]
MAIQFTVFPNSGIRIGMISQGEDLNLTSPSLPYCERDVIKYPQGLSSILLNASHKETDNLGLVHRNVPVPPPENNVLITIALKRSKIEQLKHWITIQSKKDNELASTGPVDLSTFVLTCAFMR